MWGLDCYCSTEFAWVYQEWDEWIITSLRPRECEECGEIIPCGVEHKLVIAVGGQDCPDMASYRYNEYWMDHEWAWQDELTYVTVMHFCLPCENIRRDFCCKEVPIGELREAVWECSGIDYVTGEIDDDDDEEEEQQREQDWIDYSREEMMARQQ